MTIQSISELLSAFQSVRPFISPQQKIEFSEALDGDQKPVFYIETIESILAALSRCNSSLIDRNEEAYVAHLHYQTTVADFYLIKMAKSDNASVMFFGLTVMNNDIDSSQYGLIDIAEILANGAQLDLYWASTKIGIVKMAHNMSNKLFTTIK